MNARDELAELLSQHEDCAFSASNVLVCTCGTAMQPNEPEWDLANLAAHQAEVLLAAGYSKPRQVSTVEELDALPEGSIVQGDWATYQLLLGSWATLSSPASVTPALPATVLYVGGSL